MKDSFASKVFVGLVVGRCPQIVVLLKRCKR